MPIPPAASYISGPLHQQPITTASTLHKCWSVTDTTYVQHSLDGWLEWGGGVLVSSCSGPRVSAQSPDAARLPRHQHSSSTTAGHNQQIKYHLAGRDHYRYDGQCLSELLCEQTNIYFQPAVESAIKGYWRVAWDIPTHYRLIFDFRVVSWKPANTDWAFVKYFNLESVSTNAIYIIPVCVI